MKAVATMMIGLLLAVMPALGGDVVADLRPVIKKVADKNGVDPVLMEAIMRHESAHGTSSAAKNKNNLAGIMGRNGQRSYSSKAACVEDLGRLLAKYKAKGRVTTAQIGRVYCTTGGWASHVNTHMREIKAGKRGPITVYGK